MSLLLAIIRSSFRSLVRPHLLAKVMIAAGVGLVFVALLSMEATAQPEAVPFNYETHLQQDTAPGKAIFDDKCAACHTIGGGKLVGPDLKDITKQRDIQWVKNFISDPAAMIASDPDAQALYKEYNNFAMPNMGLTTDQVDQVVAYLENPGADGAAPGAGATDTPGSVVAGDPAVGKLLFTGETPLKNGGPACISCHHVNGTGALGGGGLGPDLTQVVQRFGEPGLAAALKTLPFPTMMGPFLNHQLATDEQADLLAFFKESNQWQKANAAVGPGAITLHVLVYFGISLVIAAFFFGILWLLWLPLRKRYQKRLPVRKV